MASDEDAEELAALRAQRAARLGHGAESSVRGARSNGDSRRQFYDIPSDTRPQPTAGSRPGDDSDAGDDDEEDAPVVVGDLEEHQNDMWQHLPISFGKAEVKGVAPATVHDKTLRHVAPSIGPPRPPSMQKRTPLTDGSGAAAATAAHIALPSSLRGAEDGEPQGSGRLAGGAAADGLVGPPRPPAAEGESAAAGASGSDSDDEEDDPYQLPISHEVGLGGHTKAVVALDIDHSGSRIITGSLDYTVRIYDFNGMKSDLRAFRQIEPHDGHPVHALSWSPTGDNFLAVTGAACAKVYDRNGLELGEFTRGDMYIRDMKNTKGHISSLTGGKWHPTDKATAMTSSEDGTIRLWDTAAITQKTVIKPTLAKPGRVSVTACTFSADGGLIAAGLMDGTIQLWSVAGKFGSSAAVGQVLPPRPQLIEKQQWNYVSRATHIARNAHEPQSDICCVAFTQDGQQLASRGADGTLKVWDVRKFQQPLHVFGDLPTNYANTMCCYSPDERLLVTGVAAGSGGEGGAVVVMDIAQRREIRRIGMPSHAAALAWHHRLNQIFVGTGDRKSGSTRVLYDTTYSERGVVPAMGRQPRKPSPFDYQPPLLIKTPHALPMFREDPTRKRPRDQGKEERAKAFRPDPGMVAGIGKGGRIGTTKGTLLTQHLLKQKGALKPVAEEEDPREAILRHASKTDEYSKFFKAYSKTQPQPIFAEPDEEEEEDEGGK